jgi:small subunit ribosomal protein S5
MHNEDPETGGPIFPPTPPSASSLVLSASSGGSQEVDSAAYLASVTPLSPAEINALHRHTLVIKRVVRMTTKGKVASMYALVVAGNGKGMVGYGEGKDQNAGKAAKKAFHEAVKKMDYVKRFEGRTIFSEYTSKWGASKITLRPRPAGEFFLSSSRSHLRFY